MSKFQDISLSELNFKTQYYNDFMDNNIDIAHDLIYNNNLDEKVLKASNINFIIDKIQEIEKKYHINFMDFLKNKYNEYQIKIKNFIYKGSFSSTQQYEINNFVLYNKEIYWCIKKPPVGEIPVSSGYWSKIGLKGAEGFKSLGVKYAGTWNSNKTYSKFDMVDFGNKLYVCKVNNTNKTPNVNLNEWSLQMSTANSKILTQKETPTNINNKEIWFQIL